MRDVELYGRKSVQSSSIRESTRQTDSEGGSLECRCPRGLSFNSFSSFFNCMLNICDLNGGSAGVAPSAPSPARALSVFRSRSPPLLFLFSPSSIHLFFSFQTSFVSFVGLAFLFVCMLLSACVDEAFLPDFI